MKQVRASTVAVALFVFVFAAYASTFGHPFFFDDFHFIQNNYAIQTPANLLRIWTSATFNSSSPDQWGYRPFTTFVHSLAWITGGGASWPFHILKKTLHASVCVFLFLIWKRIWEYPGFFPENPPRLRFKWLKRDRVVTFTPTVAAGLLAAMFAIHPVNNEVVNYISATTTLLAGACYVAAYYLYLRFRDTPRAPFILGSLALYVFSVLAKEEGITLCGVVLLSELFLPRREKRGARLFAYFAMGAALALLLKFQFMESSNGARGNGSRIDYFMTQWRAYLRYIGLLFWPWDFNADNLVFGFSTSFWDVKVLSALAGNLLLLAAAWLQKKRYPIFLFSLLWFYIAVSPASSVIPLAEPVNDRRMYLAYLGLVGVFPWVLQGIERLCRREKSETISPASGAIIVACIAALLVGTETRNRVWSSQESLWGDTVEKNPESGRALNNLALVYMGRAEWDKARSLLDRCERFSPGYGTCTVNQALIFGATGQQAEAEQKYQAAINVDPLRIETRNFYGRFLEANKRFEPALAQYREIDRLTGGMNLEAKLGWARSVRALGQADEARAVLDEARARFGDRPEIRAVQAAGGGQ